MFKRFLFILLALSVCWPILTTNAATPLSSAINYLANNYGAKGSSAQDWAAIALGENGVSVNVKDVTDSSLLSSERKVLAKAAQGIERASEIATVKNTFQNNQFGSENLINDDIFGVLAVASTDPAWLASHQGVFTTIAASQRADGSFGFSASGSSDADMTAAAIWALTLAASPPTGAISQAKAFLNSCQNTDGGFGVLPGQTSSIATSSWAMIAQNSLNQDSSAVGNYLVSSQQPGGFWQQGNAANYLNTAYAAMALSGRKLPFVRPSGNNNNPPATNNQSPNTSTPNAAPSVSGPSTATPSGQKTTGTPSQNTTTAPTRPMPKKPVRQKVYYYITTTETVVTCSASASASASGGSSSASASASCN